MRARSVHSFGMAAPILVVTLSEEGRVRRVMRMTPGRLFADLGCRWILELPHDHPPPRSGSLLQVVPMLARCPGS